MENYKLIKAVSSGSLKNVIQAVEKDGADIHFLKDLVIVVAALNGYVDITQYLLKNGANIEARTQGHPLIDHVPVAMNVAAKNKHMDIIKILYNTGKNKYDKYDYAEIALLLFIDNGYINEINMLLDIMDRDFKKIFDRKIPKLLEVLIEEYVEEYLISDEELINLLQNLAKKYDIIVEEISEEYELMKEPKEQIISEIKERLASIGDSYWQRRDALLEYQRDAARVGNLSVLTYLIEKERAESSHYALYEALQNDKLSIVKYLLPNIEKDAFVFSNILLYASRSSFPIFRYVVEQVQNYGTYVNDLFKYVASVNTPVRLEYLLGKFDISQATVNTLLLEGRYIKTIKYMVETLGGEVTISSVNKILSGIGEGYTYDVNKIIHYLIDKLLIKYSEKETRRKSPSRRTTDRSTRI